MRIRFKRCCNFCLAWLGLNIINGLMYDDKECRERLLMLLFVWLIEFKCCSRFDLGRGENALCFGDILSLFGLMQLFIFTVLFRCWVCDDMVEGD
jgi:hypothetical protein